MKWKTVKLGEVLTIKYGKDHKALADGSIPVYGSGGIMRYADKAIYDKPSILIPRKGSLNNIFYVEKPFWTVDTMFWSIIDTEKADPHFLFYAICKMDFAGLNVGSAVPSLTVPVIEAVELNLPPLETQRRIAAILSSLDDKIENNNRINRNLEAQAQALFKSWFVDFEPFNDSKLVESELGFIPAKWHIESFSSLINFQEGPGIRNWQYVTENGTKFINIRCIKDGDIFTETANMISNEEANGKYAHFMLREGDIVMSCSGTLGRYAIVRKDHLPLCLNTSVIRFFPIYKNDYSYIWGLLTSSYFLNKQIEMAAGSVQANFGPTHLKQIKILVPDEINREQFNKICYPILFEIQRRRYENKRLATLRDTLLPKLMKGEITL